MFESSTFYGSITKFLSGYFSYLNNSHSSILRLWPHQSLINELQSEAKLSNVILTVSATKANMRGTMHSMQLCLIHSRLAHLLQPCVVFNILTHLRALRKKVTLSQNHAPYSYLDAPKSQTKLSGPIYIYHCMTELENEVRGFPSHVGINMYI